MRDARTSNGKWVVIGLLALGLLAAIAGLAFRQWPTAEPPTTSQRVDR
jgi:hypothetical protein